MDNVWRLLVSFMQIGFFSIGGGYATIPLIQQQVVENTGWLSLGEFTDIITISQMTPGPLAVNTSTFVGIRLAGLPGAVAATFGCVISGCVISLLLNAFFRTHGGNHCAQAVLQGLKTASVGLIASAAAAILALSIFGAHSVDWIAAGIFVSLLALARMRKANPIHIMLLAGIMGLLAYS